MSKKTEDKELHFNDLRNKIGNVFVLINLASKRVRELASGAPKLIQVESDNHMQIALEEITQGKITANKKDVPEKKRKTSKGKEKQK